MEIWKDIKGYEGIYQISNLGKVKSLSRIIINGKNKQHLKPEKTLKGTIMSIGYISVGLRKNNTAKIFYIHQLVAVAFLNHTPNGNKSSSLIVDHRDNNKLNNRLSNLQLTTMRHNTSKDKKNKTSIFTGVHLDSLNKKWKSTIRVNRKIKYLGSFTTELEASNAYQKALHSL